MKSPSTLLPVIWFSLSPLLAKAGPPSPPDQAATIAPTVDPWEITLTPYGWLAGIDGEMGMKGYTAETSVPFEDILKNLDFVAAATLEVRKGRWGGWIDGMYLKVSTDAETPGPLLNSLGVGVEQVLAEAALFYRIWQGDRSYLDVYAGARYMWLSGELSFDVSDSGIEQVSRQISDEVFDQVVSAVSSKASSALSSAKDRIASQIATQLIERVANATSRIEDAKTSARSSIASSVSSKSDQARSAIDQLQSIATAHPKLVESIRSNENLQNAIHSVAQAKIDQQVAEAQADVVAAQQNLARVQQTARAAAQAAVARARAAVTSAQAASARAQSAARKAVARAEKKLADAIEDALRDAIPSEISQSIDWVDPFIGVRARCHFTDRWYAIAKADIGGFGISSDLVWQVYAALGCQISQRTSIEVGYRHMDVDYTRGGFAMDAAVSGAMIAFGIKL